MTPAPTLPPGRARKGRGYALLAAGIAAAAAIQHAAGAAPAWSLLLLPAYVLAGWALALASTAAVNLSWEKTAVLCSPRWLRFAARSEGLLVREARVALHEELLWRVLPTLLLVDRLGLHPSVLAAVAAVFTAVHLRTIRTLYVVNLLELMLFSLVLGGAYLLWRDVLLVCTLHVVRNLSFVYLQALAERGRRTARRPAPRLHPEAQC